MSIDTEMNKEDEVYIYTMKYYSTIKKNEIMPFAATWMNQEIIILSEISQRKRQISWYNLYVESKNDTNELIYKTSTDIENKLKVTKGER